MTTAIKRRRGTTAQHATFTGLEGEITVDTTKDTLVVHDGATAGGFALLREDLSNNTNVITTTNTKTLTNKTFGDNPTFSAGTANGVAYLNGSKVLTTGSALTFDGTNLGVGGSPVSGYKAAVNGDYWQGNGGGVIIGSLINNTGWYELGASSNVNGLQFNHVSTQRWMLNSSEQMRLTSTGLGIGTSSPNRKLDVNGSIQIPSNNALYINGSNNYLYADTSATELASATRIRLVTNGDIRATLDSSGNLGLGVTPSAWGGSYKAFEGTNNTVFAGKYTNLSSNAYQDGTNWKYIATGPTATRIDLNPGGGGGFAAFIAPSGTAGNAISFTQAMTLTANGNLLIGGTNENTSRLVDLVSSTKTQLSLTYPGATTWGLGANGDLSLSFNNGSERMRIDSSGNLLVGTTSATGQVTLEKAYGGGVAISINTTNTGTAYTAALFKQGGTTVGFINANSTTTTYSTSSDYRLKENIQPMQNALDTVALLKPCTYTWKADGSDGQGFIAHELQAVVPDCVTGEKDAVDAEGNPVYQGIDTSFLVATLTKAIQEQQDQINQLKAEVAALKGN